MSRHFFTSRKFAALALVIALFVAFSIDLQAGLAVYIAGTMLSLAPTVSKSCGVTRLTLSAPPTHPDGVTLGESTTDKVSFFGVTPVVQPVGVGQAIPTDLASCIVFCTKMRADMIALGLIKGSA